MQTWLIDRFMAAVVAASAEKATASGPPSDEYLERLWRMQGTSIAGPQGDRYERNLAAATAEHRVALDAYEARRKGAAAKR